MSEINPRQAKYADIHAKLTDRMQSVRVILEQMEDTSTPQSAPT